MSPRVMSGLRLGTLSRGRSPQGPHSKVTVSKTTPKLTLETPNRVQILRRPRILVPGRGVPRKSGTDPAGDSGRLRSGAVGFDLATDKTAGWAGVVGEAQIPRVATP